MILIRGPRFSLQISDAIFVLKDRLLWSEVTVDLEGVVSKATKRISRFKVGLLILVVDGLQG
jgi:hypothetical protein